MFRISKLTDYALIILTFIGKNPKILHKASQLAECTSISKPTVSKLLKKLTQANFLNSVRGVNGGYKLLEQPTNISLFDIIQAIDGPIGITQCSLDETLCENAKFCDLKKPWIKINAIIANTLKNHKLSDLMNVNDLHCEGKYE